MPWPQPTDYNAAIQHPAVCFADPDLCQGQVVGDLFGLPRPHSGNFADVYQVQVPNQQSWAVKCFTREVHGLQSRYQAISEHLKQYQRPFMVDFRYLEQGIRIAGQWYPVVKMRWVEGFRLNEFVAEHLERGGVLERLAQMWVKLAQELREAGMAHGDLQHGNVLLVPGSKTGSLLLRLIDYDGMVVPALAEQPSGESGHPHYQHPQRLREGIYNAEVDRFAHLVIYTALRCLRLGGKSLWDRHDNGENFLFREEDFRTPTTSRLLHELWAFSDPDIHNLLGWLLLASQAASEHTPLLDELLSGTSVKPLTPSEEDVVRSLLGSSSALPPSRKTKFVPPPLPTAEPTAVAAVSSSGLDWLSSHLAPAMVLELPAPLEESASQPIPLAPPSLAAPGLPGPLLNLVSVEVAQPKAEPILDALPVEEPPASPGTNPPAANTPGEARIGLPIRAQVALLPPPRRRTIGQRIIRISDWVLERPWVIPWACGPVLLLVLFVVGMSFPRTTRPVPGPIEPPPPPPPPPPVLFLPSELVLDAGETAPLHLQVRRNGNDQPLQVKLKGLPAEVTAQAITLPRDIESAVARISAGMRADAPGQHVLVSLWEQDHKLDEKRFALTVRKKHLPDLAPVDPLILLPGEQTQLLFQVDRQGNRDIIGVKLEDLPPGISSVPCRLTPIGLPILLPGQRIKPRDRSAELENGILVVRVGKDAEPITARPVQLTLWIDGVKVANQPLSVSIEKPLPRLFLLGRPMLLIGNKEQLKVHAERRNFVGPIEVRLEELPEGVKCDPGVIPADEDSVLLDLTVAEETTPGGITVRLSGKAQEEQLPSEEVRLTFVKREAVVAVPRRSPAPRQVEFPTVDGVTLHGQFYSGPPGRPSNPVLLLHDLGQNDGEDLYSELARALQSRGLAVLTFDFRGHGGSKKVSPEFWTTSHNTVLRKSGSQPNLLQARDFPPAYWPTLVCDIAAARRFLDQRNDAGEVNSSNLIVIGAGKGATLGALWLASEWHRVETVVPGQPEVPQPEPEGSAIMTAIWLGMDNTLGGVQQPVDTWLHTAGQVGKVPMLFVHGQGDPRGTARSRTCVVQARPADGKLTYRLPIPATTSTGTYLLRDNLPTVGEIAQYIVRVAEQHKERDWQARLFAQKSYQWNFPGGETVPAKQAQAQHLAPLPLSRMGVR